MVHISTEGTGGKLTFQRKIKGKSLQHFNNLKRLLTLKETHFKTILEKIG